MILVDSSIWINHLRADVPQLTTLIEQKAVLCHPAVIGELAVGNLADRHLFLVTMQKLPMANAASHAECLAFIDRHRLHGRGIGYLDAQLLASTRMTREGKFWTTDRRLAKVAAELGLAAVLNH